MKDLFLKIALLGAIFFFSWPLRGQISGSAVEQMAEEGASADDIEDYLQQFLPLNLNDAGEDILRQSGLFTPFQIASLLEYRKAYGALLTTEELQAVDGFSKEFVEEIAPYVVLRQEDVSSRRKVEIRSRYKLKKGTEGVHQYNRFLMESGRVKAGLLAESDAGEIPLVDYAGGYLEYQKGRWKALLGDYSACFGQGLAVWNAFSFTGASSPASVLKRPRGIVPYKSADETRALRGLAIGCDMGGGWSAALFASAAGVDARVEEGGYSSLPVTGYHRTIYERKCKNAMREYPAGANLTFARDRFHGGVTAVAYTYSEHNRRKVMPYNQYQLYDGWHGNLSADILFSAGHWRFFAEGAVDSGLKPAAVAGAVFTPSYDFEMSALARYYDKAYIAPHAGAYSTISSVSNQAGAALSLLWRPFRGLLLTSFTEAVHYPWLRYRVDAPSQAFYEKARGEYTLSAWTISLQDNYVWQSSDGSRKHSLKGGVKVEKESWKASLRAGMVIFTAGGVTESGSAISASASHSFFRSRLSVTAGVAYFDAASYDARVYIYESDLPGNFSLQYYYGKGIAARTLVKVKSGRRLHLSLMGVLSATPECRLQADYKF
ncbi:MAG: helix-hairpin-helix domain-containing protein [Bacteroidales bacterium]|nr:helix-hairpin-helix domain-containing protein [Bacteroidales bacterium]